MIFSVKKKIVFFGVLGPPYCGIGATIRTGREKLCVPYAGFFFDKMFVLLNIFYLFFLNGNAKLKL